MNGDKADHTDLLQKGVKIVIHPFLLPYFTNPFLYSQQLLGGINPFLIQL